MLKTVFGYHCKLALRSRSKVGSWVKVMGQGQISGAQGLILGAQLCQVQQRAKKSHYHSKVFVCVSNNCADAVDRLLMLILAWVLSGYLRKA